jgi:hypothetical protein
MINDGHGINEAHELHEKSDEKVFVDFKSRFCKQNRGLCMSAIAVTGGVVGAFGAGLYQGDPKEKADRLIDGYLQGKVTADELRPYGIDPTKLPPAGIYNQSLHEVKRFVQKYPFLTLGALGGLGGFVTFSLRGSRRASNARADRRERLVNAYNDGLITDDQLQAMGFTPEQLKEFSKSKQLSEAINEAFETFYLD